MLFQPGHFRLLAGNFMENSFSGLQRALYHHCLSSETGNAVFCLFASWAEHPIAQCLLGFAARYGPHSAPCGLGPKT